MRLRVLGIDPGSKGTAFALIDHHGTRATWITSGFVTSSAVEAQRVVAEARAELVVVERPTWIALPKAGEGIVDTAFVAGLFYAAAFAMGTASEWIYMRDWRSFLCGRGPSGGTASDAQVKGAILQRCTGVPERTTNHVRDAAGVAFVGGLRWAHQRRASA